jgi:flagellar FliJ protein
MKASNSTLRAKRFNVDEKARKVSSLEAMVTDFQRMALELDRQICAEEERTGVKDPADVVYSTLAKATTHRRAKLLNSVVDLRARLAMGKRELEEAEAELRVLESPGTHDASRELSNMGIITNAHPT